MKKKDYLFALLMGVLFLLALWIFSDSMEGNGSSVPFLLMGAYLAAVVILSRKLSSRDAMLFSLISQLTVFLGYKGITIAGVIGDYRADGFLADYEVGPYQAVDAFLLVFLFTIFLMTAVIRFALARKKFRQIPKTTLKMIGISLVVLAAAGVVNFLSWNLTKPYTRKLDTYCQTFTPEKWSAYAPKRELMLPDFLAEYQGISQTELEQLLGQPETDDGYFVGYGGQGEMYASFVYEDGGLQDAEFVSKSPFGG